jgi:tryptophan synthase alpha chain
MGVTGARATVSDAARTLVARTREARPDIALCVGLGVSNGAQAREVIGYADAAIVGSALVAALLAAEDAGDPADLSRLRAVVDDLATGVRGAVPAR